MKLNSVAQLFIAFFLIYIINIGCSGSGGDSLARVGNYDITVQEFRDMFQKVRYPFQNPDEELIKRLEILDTLIVKRLLIQEAYAKNIDKLQELSRIVLANQDKFLLDVLYKAEILDKATVSESEIKHHYDMLEYKIRASHIVLDNIDTANMIVERLSKGENFEKLAYDYSIVPDAKRNKGDLGYFLWGVMVDEFQDAAFSMSPGEVSPPVKTRLGYHVIKIVDKLPNDKKEEFSSMRNSIDRIILDKKKETLARNYFESIKSSYPVLIDTVSCNYLLKKREYLYPPLMLANLPKSSFDLEQLDRNERELVLATWDGGQITIAEYLTESKDIPIKIRPDLDDFDSLSVFIFALKKLDILVYEALKQGIDKTDEYKRKVKLFKELNMAEIMRNDSMPEPLPADEGMMRQYYDEHPEEFSDPEQVHVYEILLSDEIQAKKLASEIQTLTEFQNYAIDLTERPGKRTVQGDLSYIERKWFPEIFDLARKTPNKKIGGPVFTQGKYSIFYVVDKLSEELKDYLDVKNSIKRKLAITQKTAAFDNWVRQAKDKTEIIIYKDAVWSMIDKKMYQE